MNFPEIFFFFLISPGLILKVRVAARIAKFPVISWKYAFKKNVTRGNPDRDYWKSKRYRNGGLKLGRYGRQILNDFSFNHPFPNTLLETQIIFFSNLNLPANFNTSSYLLRKKSIISDQTNKKITKKNIKFQYNSTRRFFSYFVIIKKKIEIDVELMLFDKTVALSGGIRVVDI